MTPEDQAILDWEKKFYRHASSKESDITGRFEMSAVRYYMQLNRILDDPEALAAEPVLVHRLRRIRDSRAKSRRAS